VPLPVGEGLKYHLNWFILPRSAPGEVKSPNRPWSNRKCRQIAGKIFRINRGFSWRATITRTELLSTEWAKKRGHKFMSIILSSLNRFSKYFHCKIQWYICSKLVIKNPPPPFLSLRCQTTFETLMSENNNLQGSIATYLRCGGVVNNQIKKGLLLSLQ